MNIATLLISVFPEKKQKKVAEEAYFK